MAGMGMEDEECLSFWVEGRPRTKGSLAGGRTGAGAMRLSDTPQSKLWRKAIKDAVVPLIADPVVVGDRTRWKLRAPWPRLGPVVLSARFYFGRLPGDDARYPIGHRYGDLDKLLRNVFDALQDAKVYREDSQVTCLRDDTGKWFTSLGAREGARIQVWWT